MEEAHIAMNGETDSLPSCQSNFLKQDSSSSSSLHLSLHISPSVPPWSDPEYLTPVFGQRNSSKDRCLGGCVED